MDINIGIEDSARQEIAGELGHLLADSYTLYLKTQNYHWNVTGPMFRALHLMFEEQYIELAGRVHDTADEATADLLADVNFAIIDRQVNEIREIDAALMRIARATYGTCVECEGDIAYERLQACDTATRCHDCQVRYEQSYAQPGHPTL